MSTVPLEIAADVEGPDGSTRVVTGQQAVATTTGRITGIRLDPARPRACPEAVEAVMDAEWVVLGPGSWFTSVMPHLLVPDLASALIGTNARRCLVFNLAAQVGETAGLSAVQHLLTLHAHAPLLRIDAVLADPSSVDDVEALGEASDALGARLVLRQVRATGAVARHDSLRLAAALRDVLDGSYGDVD
jgi:uncharacterized cofD-like protein